jgi:predicted PurR-regulated permease PerM
MGRQMRVDISHKTIFFITGFFILLWALFLIRDIILLFFVAIIFMSALAPIIDSITKFEVLKIKLPKAIAIALTYILVIGIFAGLVSLVVTPLVEQTTTLAQNLPATITNFFPDSSLDQQAFQTELTRFTGSAVTFTLGLFNNILAFISIAVLTFYLLLERDKLDHLISQFFIGKEDRVKTIVKKIEDKLGAWLRGQVVLSLIIGVLVYVVLIILDVPYALPLAILAAFMEIIPVIGPIISAVPAIAVAYVVSPVTGLFVGLAFFIIQQLENHLIVPQVMKRAVGLNPLIVILAVAIGGRLLGIGGALLAVPITVVVQIFIEDVLKDPN